MEKINRRSIYTEKYWLQMLCKLFYYLGIGEFWYEDRPSSKFYRVWAYAANCYIYTFLTNELLSHLRDDMTTKEKQDSMQLSIAHSVMCGKILVLYHRRNQIKELLKRLLENKKHIFKNPKLDRESVKTAIMYNLITSSVVYFTLITINFDAIASYYKEGIPFRTEVLYYPGNRDTGFFAIILRVLAEIHSWYLVTVLLLIDFVCVFSLTIVRYKFKRVRLFFEGMKDRFVTRKQWKFNKDEERRFRRDFVVAITLHEDALWCAGRVQRALGVFYSVQVAESIGMLVVCLVKLVKMERVLTLILANLIFITALVVVTAAYMMAGAEITYEASLVPTAIFHCGWEYAGPRSGLRPLVATALQRSQQPVYMTAFGIVILSYSNFITILRSSYSFFAVMF